MKDKLKTLKTPLNLEIKDAEVLVMLWHLFNQAPKFLEGNVYCTDQVRRVLEQICSKYHRSDVSTQSYFGPIDDCCKKNQIDPDDASLINVFAGELPITLNNEYSAIINKEKKVVEVGCQSIPFERVEALYQVIQIAKNQI